MAILDKGGSAADAAIAGILAAGVAQPVSSGLGGGGFALYWDAELKRMSMLDFREAAPIGILPVEHASRPPREKRRGVMVGVPGELAGLEEMQRRWGKLPRGELFRPAAQLAAEGFDISHHMHRALRWRGGWIKRSPVMGSVFAPLGKLMTRGQRAKNPALAKTLRRLASEGPKAFYEGAIARDIVKTARSAGSRMTRGDVKSYRAIAREPLHTRWEGLEVYSAAPPSAGGVLVIETLNMHSKLELTQHGYGSGAYLHLLAETFRGAIADRMRAIGDPAYIIMDTAALTSRWRMKRRRATISMTSTKRADSVPVVDSGTSQIIVVDRQGSVAAVASSLNHMFGARVATRAGFPLNNQLESFTMLRIQRRFRGQPNRPKGGARPVSSITPTIVLRDGSPVLALGGSGGMRIATGVAQALLARLAFDRSAHQCVADPRIDTPPTGGLSIDKTAPATVVSDLRGRGELVDNERPNFSALQLVAIGERDGLRFIEAASDPRKGGVALVR